MLRRPDRTGQKFQTESDERSETSAGATRLRLKMAEGGDFVYFSSYNRFLPLVTSSFIQY